MSDIKKGYTFTDKSTDWASNKETAIRLNKMLDDAKINLVAGTNITITPTENGPSIAASVGGTVTAVAGTLPIVSSGGTTPAISINAATTDASGSMSAADKAKLDGIAANANNYSLPKATSAVLGGVELFSDTVQTVAANPVTTTSARTYGVQLNASDQMVVNVPWVDSTFANQTEKTFFAGPAAAPAAAPAFRTIASTDLPAFGSGDVSFAVAGGVGTIGADKVTNVQLANMGANTVKVNATTSTADPTDLSVDMNTVVGRVAGNIVAAQVVTDQITDNAVTFAKLQDGVANTVIARAAATNGDVAGVSLAASQLLGRGPAGDITAISLGGNLSITGTTLNSTGSGGGIADGATLTTGLTFPIAGLHILDTDASHDLIISPGGNLTADRTLTITTGDVNRTITLTGDTTLNGSNTGDNATNTLYSSLVSNANHTGDATGSTELTITNGAVSLAKMANLAANSFIANNTGNAATPIAVTTAQATAMLNTAVGDAGAGGTKGLVPAPAIGDATKFLRGDMTYQTISGGGNALTSNPLSQFASTTSEQLAGVISDETGTGKLVFATSPTLVAPVLGTPTSGLLNSCTSNPSGTGSVPRTFQARAGDVFNVKDYGATGDYNGASGGTADEAAINAAAAALVASDVGGCLYFPAGRYKKTTKLTMSLGNVLDGLTIKGDGPGASQIVFVGANLGIDITVANPQQEGFFNHTPVDVMDLAIATQQTSGAGTAFVFNGAKSSAGVRALRISNVSIRGFAITQPGNVIQSWDSCISVTSAEGVFINNVYASVGNLSSNTFIVKYDNGAFGSCSILDIGGCSFQGSDKCVWVVGTNGPEGVIVRGTTLVNVNWGVYWDTTMGEEDLKLSDSHINSYKGCVYANNLFRSFIHDNNLFVDPSPTTGPTNLLRLGGARYGNIHDNFMRAPDPIAFSAAAYIAGTTYAAGDRVSYLSNEYTSLVNSNTGNTPSSSPAQWSPDHVGVRLASQTGMHITDNIFQRFGTDVVLESGSNGNMVVNNQAFNNSEIVIPFKFTDDGTNNAVDCQGSTTWDPASLVPGQQDFVNILCPGVKFGAQCTVGVPYDVQNMFVQATVTSANNVRVAVYNSSGSTVNLGSGTWTVRAINQGP
jgi:hypothetical protein